MLARRCAKYGQRGSHKKCLRFQRVSVSTAKGIRQGRNYHQGDRIRQGFGGTGWSGGRWKRARKIDMKRRGAKYERWERPTGRGHRIAKQSWR